MKKHNTITAVATAFALMLGVVGCSSSTSTMSVDAVDASTIEVVAENAKAESAGTTEIELKEGQEIAVTAKLNDDSSIAVEVIPDGATDAIVGKTFTATSDDTFKGLPEGTYTINVKVVETATGTMTIKAEESAEAKAKAEAATAAADYTVDYGTSEVYTKDDIDAAVTAVMDEFDNWVGATMKSISYTDDDTCNGALEFVNGLRDEGTPEFDQAMVFSSVFHSPSAEQAEGTAWDPDTDYTDYAWYLGRTEGGDWQLMTWGYA